MKIKRKVLVTSAAVALLISGGYVPQSEEVTNLSSDMVAKAAEVEQDVWENEGMDEYINNYRAEMNAEEGTNSQGRYTRIPLVRDESLNEFAQWKAQDLIDRNYYSHETPDGLSVSEQYMKYVDYNEEFIGIYNYGPDHPFTGRPYGIAENLSGEYEVNIEERSNVEAAHFESWLNSPGHAGNMRGRGYTHYGYANAFDENQGLYYGVQVFASLRDYKEEILNQHTHGTGPNSREEANAGVPDNRYMTDPMESSKKSYNSHDVNVSFTQLEDDKVTNTPNEEDESKQPESDNKDKEQEETNQPGDNGQLDEDNQPELNNNDDDAGKDENPESNKDNDEGTKDQPDEEQSPNSDVEEDSPDNDESPDAEENSEVDETPETESDKESDVPVVEEETNQPEDNNQLEEETNQPDLEQPDEDLSPDSDVEEEVSPDNDESPNAEENAEVDETPELESDEESDVPAVEEETDTEESEVDYENNENSTEDDTEENTDLAVDGTDSDDESTLDLNNEESDDGDDSVESSESEEDNVDLNNDETDNNDESETVAVEKEDDGDAEVVDAEEESLPETGEAMSNNGFLFGAVALVAGLGLFLIGRRRPENK